VAAVYAGMSAADSAAVLVLQGWVFSTTNVLADYPQIEAYLGAVNNSQMIILDLMSDVQPVFSRTNNYFNKPFIWNMLHDLVGNLGWGGSVDVIRQHPYTAKASVRMG